MRDPENVWAACVAGSGRRSHRQFGQIYSSAEYRSPSAWEEFLTTVPADSLEANFARAVIAEGAVNAFTAAHDSVGWSRSPAQVLELAQGVLDAAANVRITFDALPHHIYRAINEGVEAAADVVGDLNVEMDAHLKRAEVETGIWGTEGQRQALPSDLPRLFADAASASRAAALSEWRYGFHGRWARLRHPGLTAEQYFAGKRGGNEERELG